MHVCVCSVSGKLWSHSLKLASRLTSHTAQMSWFVDLCFSVAYSSTWFVIIQIPGPPGTGNDSDPQICSPDVYTSH